MYYSELVMGSVGDRVNMRGGAGATHSDMDIDDGPKAMDVDIEPEIPWALGGGRHHGRRRGGSATSAVTKLKPGPTTVFKQSLPVGGTHNHHWIPLYGYQGRVYFDLFTRGTFWDAVCRLLCVEPGMCEGLSVFFCTLAKKPTSRPFPFTPVTVVLGDDKSETAAWNQLKAALMQNQFANDAALFTAASAQMFNPPQQYEPNVHEKQSLVYFRHGDSDRDDVAYLRMPQSRSMEYENVYGPWLQHIIRVLTPGVLPDYPGKPMIPDYMLSVEFVGPIIEHYDTYGGIAFPRKLWRTIWDCWTGERKPQTDFVIYQSGDKTKPDKAWTIVLPGFYYKGLRDAGVQPWIATSNVHRAGELVANVVRASMVPEDQELCSGIRIWEPGESFLDPRVVSLRNLVDLKKPGKAKDLVKCLVDFEKLSDIDGRRRFLVAQPMFHYYTFTTKENEKGTFTITSMTISLADFWGMVKNTYREYPPKEENYHRDNLTITLDTAREWKPTTEEDKKKWASLQELRRKKVQGERNALVKNKPMFLLTPKTTEKEWELIKRNITEPCIVVRIKQPSTLPGECTNRVMSIFAGPQSYANWFRDRTVVSQNPTWGYRDIYEEAGERLWVDGKAPETWKSDYRNKPKEPVIVEITATTPAPQDNKWKGKDKEKWSAPTAKAQVFGTALPPGSTNTAPTKNASAPRKQILFDNPLPGELVRADSESAFETPYKITKGVTKPASSESLRELSWWRPLDVHHQITPKFSYGIPINAPPLDLIIDTGARSMPRVSSLVLTPTEQRQLQIDFFDMRNIVLNRSFRCPYDGCKDVVRYGDAVRIRRHLAGHVLEKCNFCDHLLYAHWSPEMKEKHFQDNHMADLVGDNLTQGHRHTMAAMGRSAHGEKTKEGAASSSFAPIRLGLSLDEAKALKERVRSQEERICQLVSELTDTRARTPTLAAQLEGAIEIIQRLTAEAPKDTCQVESSRGGGNTATGVDGDMLGEGKSFHLHDVPEDVAEQLREYQLKMRYEIGKHNEDINVDIDDSELTSLLRRQQPGNGEASRMVEEYLLEKGTDYEGSRKESSAKWGELQKEREASIQAKAKAPKNLGERSRAVTGSNTAGPDKAKKLKRSSTGLRDSNYRPSGDSDSDSDDNDHQRAAGDIAMDALDKIKKRKRTTAVGSPPKDPSRPSNDLAPDPDDENIPTTTAKKRARRAATKPSTPVRPKSRAGPIPTRLPQIAASEIQPLAPMGGGMATRSRSASPLKVRAYAAVAPPESKTPGRRRK